jgi:hypothetical protein
MSAPKIMDMPPRGAERSSGRVAFWVGIVLCLLGVALCVLQFRLKHLFDPWELPALTTLGALLVLFSLTRRRTLVRSIALVVLFALAAFEWYFLVVLAKLPEYEGPAQPGTMIPTFQTTRADGKPFTEKDLQDGTPSVLLFFRGRW